ncbi:MAG: hypothetical protein WC224_00665 [Sphaerochaetaceae bacterium]
MSTKSPKDDLSQSCSTDSAGLLAYPITPLHALEVQSIHDFITDIDGCAYEIIKTPQEIVINAEVEFYQDRIVINNDDFVKFKDHLESKQEFENPNLKSLLEKFLK